MQAAAAALPQLHGAEEQSLSMLVWSYGELSFMPEKSWLDAFLQACVERPKGLRPRAAAGILTGLVKLGVQVCKAKGTPLRAIV